MTQLIPLSFTSPEYMKLSFSFKSHFPDWKVTIYSIIKVNMPEHIIKKHQEFKKNQGVDANVLQLYHGTKHSCNIKELNCAEMLCKNTECCTCGIVRNGPRLSLAKTCEIGKFIWLAPTANMSHEYTGVIPPQNQTTSKYINCRAVFLMDVVTPEQFNDTYFVRSEEVCCFTAISCPLRCMKAVACIVTRHLDSYIGENKIIEMYRIDEKDTRIEGNGVSHSQERQPVPEELITLEKFPLEKVSDKMPT
ncbi:24956_t:CDS:2, partial [Racocetra persica]